MSQPPLVGIIHPLILKDDELFFLCDSSGDVEPSPALGLGLFQRDCRFLCRYALRLEGKRPSVLMHSAAEGFIARFALTNPPLRSGSAAIAEHALAITRQQTLHAGRGMLTDQLSMRNCTLDRLELGVSLVLEARFEDIFALRGTVPKRRGEALPPRQEDGLTRWRYRGADGVTRDLDLACAPASCQRRDGETVELVWSLALAPQQTAEIDLALRLAESGGEATRAPSVHLPARQETAAQERETGRRWLEGYASIDTFHPRFDAALRRSLRDIQLLSVEREKGRFIAAGAPWYVALFGRDSLMPSLQCLAYRPALATHTLRLLAKHQGRRHAPEQHEEPGKILHELRIGEMARLGEVAQRPGYASADATILFLVVLARHAHWTGSTALFAELRGAAERALDWMDQHGAIADGYFAYDNGRDGAPANQGWKDSADAITYADGSLVRGRIATVELQGYAFLAWTSLAAVYERLGEAAMAERLRARAETLRRRFNRDFWMEAEGCYCLALDEEGRRVATIASNQGHALWAGIADAEKARRCAERLMAGDMFSGWGVRTLSERARRFNPIGYHTGSVWPYDNSLILAGFRRYGCDDLALRLAGAAFDAAPFFDEQRLPEFFAGLERRGEAGPARCPRADPLQAWSAGALPYMLTSLLGLEADGFARRLSVRPLLPDGIDRVALGGLCIGEATLDLVFERRGGRIETRVRNLRGEIEIVAG